MSHDKPVAPPGLQLLLVDDNEDLRSLTAFVLERAGHTVAQAESGEAALELLHQGLVPDSDAWASGMFVGYLKKPVAPSDLLSAVRTHGSPGRS